MIIKKQPSQQRSNRFTTIDWEGEYTISYKTSERTRKMVRKSRQFKKSLESYKMYFIDTEMYSMDNGPVTIHSHQ